MKFKKLYKMERDSLCSWVGKIKIVKMATLAIDHPHQNSNDISYLYGSIQTPDS